RARQQSKQNARISSGRRGSRHTLVRVDQIFMSGRGLAVDRDGLEVEGFDQRYLGGIAAGEGGFQFGCNALLQSLRGSESDLLQEGGDQPAADPPRHAEIAVEFDRTLPQTPIDIALLVGRGAVSAVLRGLFEEGCLHARQNLTGELAAAD